MRWLAVLCVFALGPVPAAGALAAESLSLTPLDATGASVASLIDGNPLRLRAQLERPAPRALPVTFRLDDGRAIATCTVPRAARGCTTAPASTLDWFWSGAGQPQPRRTVSAEAASARATADVSVAPRPVVLVHGFMSDHTTWAAYTAADGFLARAGLHGWAVGDGQSEGSLDTGALSRLRSATKTLPENAAALQRYIAGVRRRTGAQLVDVVAHSMGGLVSRYYVARLMGERDVAQLVMLGSPHGGSDCAGLATTLGVLGPAALELRPAFVRDIFNRGITRRHGVPFHLLAGDPIAEGFRAPCSDVPSDSVVSVSSAAAIPGDVTRLPVLHTDMTGSAEVFNAMVLPRLRNGTAPQAEADATAGTGEGPAAQAAQFAQVASGRVEAGSRVDIEVQLDDVAVAAFALFDPSRELEVTVRGASGRVVALTAREHGLVKVDDPASLLTLGYGFANPRPGPWRVTLFAPRQATDYAISARVAGGAGLRAQARPLSAARGQAVHVSAELQHPTLTPQAVAMYALVRQPDGSTLTLEMPGEAQGEGTRHAVAWRPTQGGLHGVDIVARARAGALALERHAFLAVEVRP